MANQEFVEALNDCINRLTEGQGIEDCVRQYPQFAQRLNSMLQTGALVYRASPDRIEVRAAQEKVRQRLQQYQGRREANNRFRSLLATGAVAASIVVGVVTMTAQNTLPGDNLYGVKLLSENVRSVLDPAYSSRAASEQRRIGEIQKLLAIRRPAEVKFEGAVQAQNGTAWRIADLDVQVPPSLSSAAVGDQVAVTGTTTTTGTLVANEITIMVAMPQPTVTSTPTFTITASPTSTRLPAKPAITIQPTKAAPRSPSATNVPITMPTNTQPTAVPHDGSQDNSHPANTPSGYSSEDHPQSNNPTPDS